MQIPISDFHKAGVERRAKRYLEKMQTIQINFNNQAHEVEVLPFEELWKFIILSLENKFSYSNLKTSSKRKNVDH